MDTGTRSVCRYKVELRIGNRPIGVESIYVDSGLIIQKYAMVYAYVVELPAIAQLLGGVAVGLIDIVDEYSDIQILKDNVSNRKNWL